MVFLRCRGNIREVEKRLGISYPTVDSHVRHIYEKLNVRTIGSENWRLNAQNATAKNIILGMIPHNAPLLYSSIFSEFFSVSK